MSKESSWQTVFQKMANDNKQSHERLLSGLSLARFSHRKGILYLNSKSPLADRDLADK